MRYKSVIFAVHESIKNMGNFREYLIDNTDYLMTFHFPHGYLPKPSYIEIYKKSNLIKRKEFSRYKGKSNIIKLLLYYCYFYYAVLRFGKNGSFVIVENPVFCVLNGCITFFKKTKFVFWVGDYFPQNSGFMWFYNKLADFYNKTLKYVIYVSPTTFEVYRKRAPQGKNQFRKVISLGMKKNFSAIKLKKNKIILGFIGVIREHQGLDLVFKLLEKENYTLEIIGSGYSLNHYKKLAGKLKITKKIRFYGFVKDPSQILRKWAIGLALYEDRADNVSKYCEPVKIKDYLAYGLPVITTRTTYMYKELEKYKAGEIVDENTQGLGRAIRKIENNYKAYELGIKEMLKDYEYQKWYKNHLSFLESKR